VKPVSELDARCGPITSLGSNPKGQKNWTGPDLKALAVTEETKFQPLSRTSSWKLYIQLDTDGDGNPLLPELTEWPSKGMDKKALIRSYVGSAYCE
jgi:hypothetical protein